jgi:ParB-like chromosome segregation protein Spo0J
MNDDTTMIAPEDLRPLHAAHDKRKLNSLALDMRKHGWRGRPLLVIQRQEAYIAWTGSHRIAAAMKAGLEAVPCYVVQEDQLQGEVDAVWGHVEDWERLKAIRQTEDETAIHIMWLEGRD